MAYIRGEGYTIFVDYIGDGYVKLDDWKNVDSNNLMSEMREIAKLNEEHNGYAWVSFNNWPKPLHQGLRNTLQNKANLTKLETVFKLVSLMEQK